MDLKSRGLPLYLTLAVVVVGLLVASYGNSSREDLEGTVNEDTSYSTWIIGWIVWAVMRLGMLLLLMFVMLLGVLISRQRSILYVPVPPGTQRSPGDNPPQYRSPEAWRLPYEDVWITAADGTKVHAWLVYQKLEGASEEHVPYTFLYLHGNAGNIGHRLENVRDMHRHLGVNVLILDYRGYGDSEDGTGPSEAGFMQDAAASYRWLIEKSRKSSASGAGPRIRADRVLFFGRSIGGAVAVCLAAQVLRESRQQLGQETLPLPVGLILENTFTSLRDMAMTLFPFLRPLRPLLRSPLVFDEWRSAESLEYLAKSHEHWCCCLMSGLQDQIVPPVQMKEIHNILKKNRPKVLKCFNFPYGGHNDTPQRGGPEYWESFKKFMDLVKSTEEERRQAS